MYKVTIQNTENGMELTRDFNDDYFSKDPVAIGSDIQEMWDAIREEFDPVKEKDLIDLSDVFNDK